MMPVDFKFMPKDYVRVTLHNLGFHGRVEECIFNGDKVYLVEVWANGEPKTKRFYEDELEAYAQQQKT